MMNGGHARAPQPVKDRLRGSWTSLPERFWPKVHKLSGDDACWEWTRGTQPGGYGVIDNSRAHRVSYYLATGIDPGEMFVCHRCDNPPCVRPSHLFLGDPGDNVADMDRKGRRISTFTPKLTEADAERLCLIWSEGEMTHAQLGAAFGVSRRTAGRIVAAVESKRQRAGLPTGREKLTEDQLSEIHNLYGSGAATQYALADRYGVTQSLISRIVNGHTRGGGR